MNVRHVLDGVPNGSKHLLGQDVPGWLLFADSGPSVPAYTGGNSAGNGGNGYFAGSLIDTSHIAFEPLNMAQSGVLATAVAYQANIAYFDQSATQIAGVGGDGGDGNAASGGNVGAFAPNVLGFGAFGLSGAIGTGDNNAGNGGDGHFLGAMVHAPVAVYNPINIAVAGSHATADAHQANIAYFDQSAIQIAGVGGDGGDDNAASGGNVGAFGSGASGAISTGENSAGNGGDGYAYGGLVHATFAFYFPINIAIAGYNSTAHADQENNVVFDQSAVQMAGVGGDGGNGNAAIGGTADIFSSILELIGSDVIATGNNSAGNGGNGHFAGSLVDIDVAIYVPVNIAVAGYNSTAEAYQDNNVQFDQSTIQMAGIGGDGGHGNAALGGDFAMQLLSDLHLLDHA
jgi:hypothetical protein